MRKTLPLEKKQYTLLFIISTAFTVTAHIKTGHSNFNIILKNYF